MADICGDNRFELIEKYKQRLLDATNIEDSPEEMAVIDNILFRFWQMGWLDRLELFGISEQLEKDHVADHGNMVGDLISRRAALDALGKRPTVWTDDNDYAHGMRNQYDMDRLAIETVPSAQQWIPWDSGKFPKESGTYTVTAYDGATKRVTYAKYQKRLKRWELTGARAYWRVLAWMEKPEPWKGDTP